MFKSGLYVIVRETIEMSGKFTSRGLFKQLKEAKTHAHSLKHLNRAKRMENKRKHVHFKRLNGHFDFKTSDVCNWIYN